MHPALLGIGRLLGLDGQIEVELVEGGGPGLAAAGAGQHAQADDPGGALIGIGAEGLGEALHFFEGQEPLAGGFGALAEAGRQINSAHFPRDGKADADQRIALMPAIVKRLTVKAAL